MSAQSEYTAKQITVLEGLEPVRRRPGMYIGGTGIEGLHHLIWEVVDNSIDEAMAGHATQIKVELMSDNKVVVFDNGRGIPVDIHPQTKKSALETVLTTLHAGGKFGEGGYKVSGGLHGVGVSVVNALSSWMRAEVYRDGKLYCQEYVRGKPKAAVKCEGTTDKKGTSITFVPDTEIFGNLDFSINTILVHLRQQAYLTKKVTIRVCDHRKVAEAPCYNFYFEGGVASYVKHINKNKEALNDPPIYIEKTAGEVTVEAGIAYTDDYNEHVFTFANNIHTTEGGSHLTGFRTALTRALNDYAKKMELVKGADLFSGDDTREGLTAVISVKLPNPQFEGQTKAKLGNPEIKNIVEQAVLEGLGYFLEEHPAEAKKIIEKCALSLRARVAAKAARETVIRKGALEGMTLPGKLADCSEKNAQNSELYIVEGDSAGGCFAGDTKIALADGRNISFKELAEEDKRGKQNFCYTMQDNGHIGIAPILNPRMTKRNTKVIKIILDNYEELICTPDHLFMLRDGSYLPAEKLTAEMSLMPLKRKLSKLDGRITISGYEMVLNPATHRWIFSHMLADNHNLQNNIYSLKDGSHKHHQDFNKLNNNPNNIIRLTQENHLELHRKHVKKTLHTAETIAKCNAIKKSTAYRQKISQTIKNNFGAMLSQKAKKQWEDPAYKEYMLEKYMTFYRKNKSFRNRILAIIDEAQKKYWSKKENRLKQAERVKEYFATHPDAKKYLSDKAKVEWSDQKLLVWRKERTAKQWTETFRQKRKIAYNQVYLNAGLDFAKRIYEKTGDINLYDQERLALPKRNPNLIRLETLINRFFNGDKKQFVEAVENFNHKIKKIEKVSQRIDVYDIEVPNTHNFALASGVFVHNSAKQGRDRKFQAILPLRGKILNVERARLDRMLGSEEIKQLIIAMGTSIGETLNMEKMRYGRIIIMTDADVDGSHIRTLLLTLFYRHFQDIIKKGHLYIAQPPLYLVQKGKTKEFAYNDEQKDALVKKLGKDGMNIQRYKGLGEMNPTQLWDTTMNPENRILLKVGIEDAERADEIFSMLMGDEVGPRKRFIQTHAKNVKNLDV